MEYFPVVLSVLYHTAPCWKEQKALDTTKICGGKKKSIL